MAGSASSNETAVQDVIKRLLEKKANSNEVDSFAPVLGNTASIHRRREVFGAAITEFKERTGLPCAIVKWDHRGTAEWWCSPGKDVSDFCYIVRNLGNRSYSDCLECDMCVAKHAKDIRSPLLHRCHCGISEMAIPITDGNSARYVFITGQMQPLGGFAAEYNKPLLVTEAIAAHLAGKAAGLGKDPQNNSAPEETVRHMEPARHALREHAHQMTTFNRGIVVKIAAFLKHYLVPKLEEERGHLDPKSGGGEGYSVDWRGLNAVTSARLDLGECTEALEARTHQSFFPNEHDHAKEVALNMDAYLALTYLKKNNMISLTSRRAATTVPRNILTVLDAIQCNRALSFYESYLRGPDQGEDRNRPKATLFTVMLYKWMRQAHPYLLTDFYRNSPEVGRAPDAECPNGVLQTVELKGGVENTLLSEVSSAWAQNTYNGITEKLSKHDASSLVKKLWAELELAHTGQRLQAIDLYDKLAMLTQCRRPDEKVVAITGLLQEMCGSQEEIDRARVFQAFRECAGTGFGVGLGQDGR